MVIRRFFLLAVMGAVSTALAVPAADKPETWIEVRSPHFVVVSNASESQARRTADQFEQIRAVFQAVLPKVRVDTSAPLIILAAKNEKTLKTLLPQFWEKKGSVHPAGLFQPGEEKNYVGLNLEAYGENPFKTIYHEYVHLLIRLNFTDLPAWLNEGFAEFYGNTVIEEKEVGLGRPSGSQLRLLQEEKLLPLDVFFAVDHQSPHYNERDKAGVFYAQAWAIVHYLMLGDKSGENRKLLVQYLNLIQQDVPSAEAGRRAFGDLKAFEKKVNGYVRQYAFFYMKMKPAADLNEKDFPLRALSAAEAAAVRGDFLVHTGRAAEGRALLEEALRLDPQSAAAHESMGLLHLRENNPEEAFEWFAKAAKLDSKSYLAHYYNAMLLMRSGTREGTDEQAEASLRRAIELNPNFAPAYSNLASLYVAGGEKLDEALQLARKAAGLEPGQLYHHINLAQVLLSMERADEALRIGQRILAAAKTPSDVTAANQVIESAQRYSEYLARRKRAREEEAAAARALEELNKNPRGAESKEPTGPTTEMGPKLTRRLGSRAPAGPRASAYGRIAAVSCSGTNMDLTLDLSGYALKVRSPNYFQLELMATDWDPPANFQPCRDLKGLLAKVVYIAVQDQGFGGELQSIEIRTTPPSRQQMVQPSAPAPPVSSETPAAGAGKPATGLPRQASVRGTITSVTCSAPSVMVVTIEASGQALKLRAVDRAIVAYFILKGTLPAKFDPCTFLRQKVTQIIYEPVTGKPYAGDILGVEIQP